MRSALLALLLASLATAVSSQQIRLEGRVVDVGTGAPASAATVTLRPAGGSTQADDDGRFRFAVPGPGTYTLSASRIGFVEADTILVLRADTFVVLALESVPLEMDAVDVRVLRPRAARSGRELFEAEIQPGLVGISRAEVATMPALGEVDVLRALQALPGVVAVNDLSATLHVMGGGPDQNVFLWDGARVYAPNHMFGILGTFPPAAIDGIEFYRGSIPARFGGGLSSVVDIRQGRADDGFFADGAVGSLAASLTAGGPLPLGEGTWMLGGRRTHVDRLLDDLMERHFPYSFHDAHGQLVWAPTPAHHVQASFLISDDDFASPADEDPSNNDFDLRSRWSNRLGSLSWTRTSETGWSHRVGAAWSGYSGSIQAGDQRGASHTENRLDIARFDIEVGRQTRRTLARFGADVQAGQVDLVGDEAAGGYIEGGRWSRIAVVGGYGELTYELGPVEVVPALRIEADMAVAGVHVQPRITGRWTLSDDLSLTLGAGRTAQRLHTLSDARTVLPGAPLWVAPAEGEPVSVADGVNGTLTQWLGRNWSIEAGGYARRFTDVPVWFPEGRRTLDQIRFDDGTAAGFELMVRRHVEPYAGWLSYTFSSARHQDSDTGIEYRPPWDRRHSLAAALSSRLAWGTQVSLRLGFGTGTPFWPFGGYQVVPRLSSRSGQLHWRYEDLVPYWSDEQLRMPQHFRLDLGARWDWTFWGARWQPFVSILNITARPNVLYYSFYAPIQNTTDDTADTEYRLVPKTASPTNRIPSFGLNIYF